MKLTPFKWEDVTMFTVTGTQVIMHVADLRVIVECRSAGGISLMLRDWSKRRGGQLAFPPEFEVSISPISQQSGITGK
jgi:hypothetical protein